MPAAKLSRVDSTPKLLKSSTELRESADSDDYDVIESINTIGAALTFLLEPERIHNNKQPVSNSNSSIQKVNKEK